ncbi:MAG: protein translocase SEC61 complex subunit gamma [Candidatus Bathyarchaeia archaeon]
MKLGLKTFIQSCARLLKMSKKPGKREFWLSIKISLLGVLLIGVVGFIIKFISGVIQGIAT